MYGRKRRCLKCIAEENQRIRESRKKWIIWRNSFLQVERRKEMGTLWRGCASHFPDAPTERGVKHLRELTAAVKDGYRAMLAFVIQMDGVSLVKPNISTHAEFGVAMDEAISAGVEVLFLKCHVEPDTLVIVD